MSYRLYLSFRLDWSIYCAAFSIGFLGMESPALSGFTPEDRNACLEFIQKKGGTLEEANVACNQASDHYDAKYLDKAMKFYVESKKPTVVSRVSKAAEGMRKAALGAAGSLAGTVAKVVRSGVKKSNPIAPDPQTPVVREEGPQEKNVGGTGAPVVPPIPSPVNVDGPLEPQERTQADIKAVPDARAAKSRAGKKGSLVSESPALPLMPQGGTADGSREDNKEKRLKEIETELQRYNGIKNSFSKKPSSSQYKNAVNAIKRLQKEKGNILRLDQGKKTSDKPTLSNTVPEREPAPVDDSAPGLSSEQPQLNQTIAGLIAGDKGDPIKYLNLRRVANSLGLKENEATVRDFLAAYDQKIAEEKKPKQKEVLESNKQYYAELFRVPIENPVNASMNANGSLGKVDREVVAPQPLVSNEQSGITEKQPPGAKLEPLSDAGKRRLEAYKRLNGELLQKGSDKENALSDKKTSTPNGVNGSQSSIQVQRQSRSLDILNGYNNAEPSDKPGEGSDTEPLLPKGFVQSNSPSFGEPHNELISHKPRLKPRPDSLPDPARDSVKDGKYEGNWNFVKQGEKVTQNREHLRIVNKFAAPLLEHSLVLGKFLDVLAAVDPTPATKVLAMGYGVVPAALSAPRVLSYLGKRSNDKAVLLSKDEARTAIQKEYALTDLEMLTLDKHLNAYHQRKAVLNKKLTGKKEVSKLDQLLLGGTEDKNLKEMRTLFLKSEGRRFTFDNADDYLKQFPYYTSCQNQEQRDPRIASEDEHKHLCSVLNTCKEHHVSGMNKACQEAFQFINASRKTENKALDAPQEERRLTPNSKISLDPFEQFIKPVQKRELDKKLKQICEDQLQLELKAKGEQLTSEQIGTIKGELPSSLETSYDLDLLEGHNSKTLVHHLAQPFKRRWDGLEGENDNTYKQILGHTIRCEVPGFKSESTKVVYYDPRRAGENDALPDTAVASRNDKQGEGFFGTLRNIFNPKSGAAK